jgi:ABC-type phosphate transport system substrate-binding protein
VLHIDNILQWPVKNCSFIYTNLEYTTEKKETQAFLCSSGPMFITENTFIDLKTDVHRLDRGTR